MNKQTEIFKVYSTLGVSSPRREGMLENLLSQPTLKLLDHPMMETKKRRMVMNKNPNTIFIVIKSFVITALLGGFLAACSSTPSPEPTIDSQFWLGRTYVDKDATLGLNNGTNWVNAFTSLQDALDCARQAVNPCPGPIWVAKGTYYPDEGLNVANNDSTESFYLVEGINMYGGFDGIGAGGVGGVREQLLSQRDVDLYKTILSGDIRQNDVDTSGDGYIQPGEIVGANSEHVVYVDASASAVTSSTVLDGFRIFQGKNTSSGAGLYCSSSGNSCNPTLANLVFRGNTSWQGGAVANYYSTSSYTHVAFIENESSGGGTECGGAIYNYSSNLIMNDVQFTDNSAYSGGAMCNISSSPAITDAIFEFNSAEMNGGAIYNEEYEGVQSNPVLTDVTLFDNSAGSGGAMYGENSGPTLLNVGFYGNTAAVGGAMSNVINGGLGAGVILPLNMTNVVFSGNSATDDGGAIWNTPDSSGGTLDITIVNASFSRNSATDEGGSIYTVPNNFAGFFDIDIVNSIMWNSTSSAGFNEICLGSGQVTIRYSDVRGILGAGVTINCDGGISTFINNGNNRNQTPRFIDADGLDGIYGTLDDNLDLQNISPLIDRGRNASSPQALDFINRTRTVDGPDANNTATVDMGAFEYQ